LGHVTTRTAAIWLQTAKQSTAVVEYWDLRSPAKRLRSTRHTLSVERDFATHITLTGLEPGQRYGYRVLLDNAPVKLSESLFFNTQPLWQWRTDPPDFTVYLGSCAYLNDAPFDRPGKPYGADYRIFSTIAAAAAANHGQHFMLWLGDNVYLREADYDSSWGMGYRYRHARALPELQKLLRVTHHYAIWDDHDYGPNNSNRSFVFKDTSLELFKRYWANPSYGLPDTPGIFGAFSFGDADFFLLDDRYYRAHDMELADDKTMLGAAQLDWLKQALLQSTATFKVIANGSQLLNDANDFEGWNHFLKEREVFIDWLDRERIEGVFFLSGDRHHTELIKRERANGYPLHELTCSPLVSGPRTASEKERNNPQLVAGTTAGQRNFCTLNFTGRNAERAVRVAVFDSAGAVLWQHNLPLAQMKYPVP
ncbi:MAG: alkaline phosphatase D family protein, partial [Burkholderiales bacterium]